MQNVLQSCPTCEATTYSAIPIVQWLETLPGLLTLEFPVWNICAWVSFYEEWKIFSRAFQLQKEVVGIWENAEC